MASPNAPQNTSTASPAQPKTNEPSLIGGHAQYAKGYVESAIGDVTGNTAWKESGKGDMEEGVQSMKEANKNNTSEPVASGIGGKIEQSLGSATGCEGMEKEGAARQQKAM